MKAEVFSVGDEMVSGQRLDTNSQWISQSLGDMGIQVAFHTTVGDCVVDHVAALRVAADRADLIVMTGGLGPTADDLTREVIASVAGVELELHEPTLQHILSRYRSYGRPMPESNRSQAMFPSGCDVIPNREGTAPGIDVTLPTEEDANCRIIALPGVPVEMKQMWDETVAGRIRQMSDDDAVICHRTLHCFGLGESTIESMMPDLVRRGRDPSVGITASAATISLRVSTRGKSIGECDARIVSTLETIRECLGDLVFGEDGTTLEEVVAEKIHLLNQSIAVLDYGLSGAVGGLLSEHLSGNLYRGCQVLAETPDRSLVESAIQKRHETGSEWMLVIGPILEDEEQISMGKSMFEVALLGPEWNSKDQFRYSGHSGWRKQRAIKQVLNFCRLRFLDRERNTPPAKIE